MDNFLDNGTVLPSGLLSGSDQAAIAGFNKAYRNTQLRMGIVSNCYPVSDSQNVSKLTNEYDVYVFEQCEDRGSTVIKYRNCIDRDSLGSIADFFEKTLRIREGAIATGDAINTSGQNGAVVLLQCLDGMSDKAIIIGGITHPDRNTNLINSLPYLEGEYNGVNITIENDGSATLTFKGATDNDGNPTNSSQGNTVVSIGSDGSFQIQHSSITFTLARSGEVTITNTGSVNINCSNNTNINANGNVAINASGEVDIISGGALNVSATGTTTIDGSSILLGSSAAEAVVKGDTFQELYNSHTHTVTSAPGVSGPPLEPMSASALSTVVQTE